MDTKGRVLIVDDDPDFASTFADMLSTKGFEADVCGTAADAMLSIEDGAVDCVLLDIGLPDASGMDLIRRIVEADQRLPIIMVTGVSSMDTAIDAIKRGAYDYVVKPIDFGALWVKLGNAIESRKAFRTIAQFEQEVVREHGFDRLTCRSDIMKAIVLQLKQLSESDATVLITGESGVGKELAATSIHYNGPRKLKPFVAVSCAAMPETLIENELFGHEKGSFTDAVEMQHGKFEHANGGTVFLDEIGDLSQGLQTKLLRVLQERSFQRIGGVKEISVDVRVIAATNKDLEAAVERKEFRSDLFYRLSVLPIHIPALRERMEDVIPLAQHFLKIFSLKVGKPFTGFSKDAEDMLMSYAWPGNVRELQNAIERAAVFGRPPEIKASNLSLGVLETQTRSGPGRMKAGSLEELEAKHIETMLRKFEWNISKTAEVLGIGRDTLYRKIKQYGIKQNP